MHILGINSLWKVHAENSAGKQWKPTTRTSDDRIGARTKFLDAEGCLKVGKDSAPGGTLSSPVWSFIVDWWRVNYGFMFVIQRWLINVYEMICKYVMSWNGFCSTGVRMMYPLSGCVSMEMDLIAKSWSSS